MAYEIEHVGTHSLNYYAKPTQPLVYASWGDDAEALTEVETNTGYYYADVVSPAAGYLIYLRAGGSPANSDTVVGQVSTVAQQTNDVADDIKEQTDKLTFTANNIVDTGIFRINDTPVLGDGVSPKWGP